MRYLYFHDSFETAVSAPRIHHQLVPMHLEYEDKFPNHIVDGLRQIGHKVYEANYYVAILTAIGREGGKLVPFFDKRFDGSSEVF